MELLSNFGLPIAIAAIVIAVIAIVAFINRNYLKCAPNEVLVLYGKKNRQSDGTTKGYRVINGGAAFRTPIVEMAQRMTLGLMQVEVQIDGAPNRDGVRVSAEAVANVKINAEMAKLMAAVERFLGLSVDEIREIIKNILEGNLRQIIGTMTIEEIVQDREKLGQSVLQATQSDLDKIGVSCDNFVIKQIADKQGYIESLGTKKTAEVKRDAAIGQAEADREAAVKTSIAKRESEKAKLDNEAMIAEAQRDLQIKKAGFLKETAAAEAEANLAGEIARTAREKELVQRKAEVEGVQAEQQTFVAEKQAVLKQKQLIAEVIRPAEAERERLSIVAEGAKSAALINAEAAKQKQIIEAGAAAEALTLSTKAQSEAAVIKATADADATKAKATAEQARLTAEGEGKAAAEAASKRQLGLAEAEANKAKLLAEAEGVRAKGEAEGAAIEARLMAEAKGIDAKNKALSSMDDGARMVIILEKLPGVLDSGGEAFAKVMREIFTPIGHGLSAIDEIRIIDMGNGQQGGGVGKFAASIPSIVFEMMQKAKASGVDLDGLLGKIGIKFSDFGKGLPAPAKDETKKDDSAAAA